MQETYFSQRREDHLVDILDWAGSKYGLRAICFPAQMQRETYLALAKKSREIAGGLVYHGVQPGNVVGILFSNCSNFITSYFGVLRARAVVVPLPGMQATDELGDYVRHLETVIADADIDYIVLEDAFARFVDGSMSERRARVLSIAELCGTGTAAPDWPISPDDSAMVQVTRRGAASAVEKTLSHQDIVTGLRAFSRVLELSSDDINDQCSPMSEYTGLMGMLAGVGCGVIQYIWPSYFFTGDPDGWKKEVMRQKATICIGVNGHSADVQPCEPLDLPDCDDMSVKPACPSERARSTSRSWHPRRAGRSERSNGQWVRRVG